MEDRRLPDIPTYYKKYKNANVDLTVTTSMACEFHNEEHGKSFTYNPKTHRFRCYGKCHTGGTVIDLHMLNYGFKTREEAEASLYALEGIKKEISFERRDVNVDDSEVRRRVAYSMALAKATTVKDWLELDYIMSQTPVDVLALELFIESRKA